MIRIKNLTVGFNQGTPMEKIVLKRFNLEVNDGDFICILGSNGAGKSTLFNALLGTVDYSGEIYLDDKLLNGIPQHKRAKEIGVVYQDPLRGTAPNLSVFENMLLSTKGRVSFMKKREYKDEATHELKSYGLGLENQLDTAAKELSGGQRQSLTLYMATNSNPKVLLLDEHTAALDPKTQEIVMEITDRIVREKGISTLMITHNLKTALKYGNRLIILNAGKVVLDISGEEKMNMTEEALLKTYSGNFSDVTLLQQE
jgi:putative ABC transport system ATP-binding protein